jgi:hypothetical protein
MTYITNFTCSTSAILMLLQRMLFVRTTITPNGRLPFITREREREREKERDYSPLLYIESRAYILKKFHSTIHPLPLISIKKLMTVHSALSAYLSSRVARVKSSRVARVRHCEERSNLHYIEIPSSCLLARTKLELHSSQTASRIHQRREIASCLAMTGRENVASAASRTHALIQPNSRSRQT